METTDTRENDVAVDVDVRAMPAVVADPKPVLRLATVSSLLESSHSKDDGVVFRRSYLSMSTRTFDDDDDAIEYFGYVDEDVSRWFVELDRKWVKRRGLIKAKDYMRHALNLPEVRLHVGDHAAALLREKVQATWGTRESEIMERRRNAYSAAVPTESVAAASTPVEADVDDALLFTEAEEGSDVRRLLLDISRGQRELIELVRGALRDARAS